MKAPVSKKKPQPERLPGSLSDKYLTVERLAEELGMHRRTLDRWHRLRIGPPRIRVSQGFIRYRRAAVEEWLQKRETANLR